jgi:hypothetical protein
VQRWNQSVQPYLPTTKRDYQAPGTSQKPPPDRAGVFEWKGKEGYSYKTLQQAREMQFLREMIRSQHRERSKDRARHRRESRSDEMGDKYSSKTGEGSGGNNNGREGSSKGLMSGGGPSEHDEHGDEGGDEQSNDGDDIDEKGLAVWERDH